MDHLRAHSRSHAIVKRAAEHFTCRDGQDGSHALTSCQQGVPHRLAYLNTGDTIKLGEGGGGSRTTTPVRMCGSVFFSWKIAVLQYGSTLVAFSTHDLPPVPYTVSPGLLFILNGLTHLSPDTCLPIDHRAVVTIPAVCRPSSNIFATCAFTRPAT